MKLALILSLALVLIIAAALYFVSRKWVLVLLFVGLSCGAGAYKFRTKIRNILLPFKQKVKQNYQVPVCAVTIKNLSLKRDDYKKYHRPSAEKRSKMKLVDSNVGRDELIANKVLVPLKGMDGYQVQHMNYGSPYVHSDTKIMLEGLQQRFAEALSKAGLEKTKIVISSAYRTTSDQARLRKKYPGTATKGVSSHSYGASVDIPWLEGPSCAKAKSFFQSVLTEMQEEGKLYICPESVTIHLTVR